MAGCSSYDIVPHLALLALERYLALHLTQTCLLVLLHWCAKFGYERSQHMQVIGITTILLQCDHSHKRSGIYRRN